MQGMWVWSLVRLTKIPHAPEQLSLSATTTEPMSHNQRVCALQQKNLKDATKIQHNRINKYILKMLAASIPHSKQNSN